MKTYEIVDSPIDPILKVTEENGKIWWVEIGSTSKRYQEYLRYTAWVEAGNNPDEFWTQTELTEMGEEI
jgi:hypothetical protein